MTPTTRLTNKGVWVGRVPAVGGTDGALARVPASHNTRTMPPKRANSMAAARVTWKKFEVTVRPAKALPLLLPAEA